jgi:hypothetical protein
MRVTRGALGAVAMMLAVAALGACTSDEDPAPPAATTTTVFTPTCEPVETFPDQGQRHLKDGAPFDRYNSTPGTSGPHWGTPADPGYYGTRVPEPALVHNMEHGQVVVYYHALKRKDLHRVQQYVLKAKGAVIGARAPVGVDAPITLAAWTTLQTCDGFSEPLVDAFRRKFQGKGPEKVYPRFRG